MNLESRVSKLEKSTKPGRKIVFRYIEQDDPEYTSKFRQAEDEVKATGDYLVVFDREDGLL